MPFLQALKTIALQEKENVSLQLNDNRFLLRTVPFPHDAQW